MFETAGRLARRLYRALAIRWHAAGTPFNKETWDSQYSKGHWDALASVDYVAVYLTIAGYIHHLHPSSSILDVGCGAGNFLKFLELFGFRNYLGVDLSSEAVERARSLAIPNARFEQASYEDWDPTERFDVIVFEETLFYARRPVDVLLRFERALNAGGSIIVSMLRARHVPHIWRSLDRDFAVINSTRLENDKGERWDIKVLRGRISRNAPD